MKLFLGISLALLALSASVLADTENLYESEQVDAIMAVAGEEYWDSAESRAAAVAPFTCDTTTKYEKATSVHALRPNDIEMIGAYGDSLTAANGAKAKTVIGVLEQCRGVSWTIGGEKDISSVFTLANVFKKYTPSLRGFSTGSGKAKSAHAHLNQAVPGATSHTIYPQVVELVKKFKELPDSDNQWKLITLFIGGNDLCQFCNNRTKFSADNYANNIATTLDYLHANMQKTLVQVVITLNVLSVNDLKHWSCEPLQQLFCGCAKNAANHDELQALVAEYQQKTLGMINSGRWDTREDFTVVAQPFMTKMTAPVDSKGDVDLTYFSKDCFHFSTKGHGTAALELWNSMLIPVQDKPLRWIINNVAQCPSESAPFIFTNKNSIVKKYGRK